MTCGAVLVTAAGLLAAGCGRQVPPGRPPAVADASKVDMCTILTDAELSHLGIRLDTREPVDQVGSVGCEWLGKPFTLSLVVHVASALGPAGPRIDSCAEALRIAQLVEPRLP